MKKRPAEEDVGVLLEGETDEEDNASKRSRYLWWNKNIKSSNGAGVKSDDRYRTISDTVLVETGFAREDYGVDFIKAELRYYLQRFSEDVQVNLLLEFQPTAVRAAYERLMETRQRTNPFMDDPTDKSHKNLLKLRYLIDRLSTEQLLMLLDKVHEYLDDRENSWILHR